VERTGPALSLVIASRATPSLSLGRLRARGAVSRIDGDDLCFDVPETDRLFRDAYHQPLDADVVVDLIDRTEGWAALLSLVRTSLDGRPASDARGLVRSLSGAAGEVRDYLAEEVVDHLPSRLAAFMVQASLLEIVEPEGASVLGICLRDECESMIREAADLGLLVQVPTSGGHRFFPLVRDYLSARLRQEIGTAAVRAAHNRLGAHYAGDDWRLAAHHYRAGDQPVLAAQVIQGSLGRILGGGQYRAAADLLADADELIVVSEVLRSRLLLQVGAVTEARAVSAAAVESARAQRPDYLSLALQNAASVSLGSRQYKEALAFAERAVGEATVAWEREQASAYVGLISASGTGSFPALVHQLESLLAGQCQRAYWHHAAITSLNLAQILVWLDRDTEALRHAVDAERFLRRSSQGYELVSVHLVKAQAEAHLGHWATARALLDSALATAHPEGQAEAVLEAAGLAAWFGPEDLPERLLSRIRREFLPADWKWHWQVIDLWLERQPARRLEILRELPSDPPYSLEAGAAFRWHFSKARAYLAHGDRRGLRRELARAQAVSEAQRSPVEGRLLGLLMGIGSGVKDLSRVIESWGPTADPFLGVLAYELVQALPSLSDGAASSIGRAVDSAPHRWRPALRASLQQASPEEGLDRVASLLEEVGEPADVWLLRNYSRKAKRAGRSWGANLARRLAPRAHVDDLGPISISIGDRLVDGRGIRRKVLALLAFLVSQPNGSATPDRVMDALWPDLDPEQGSNSIHQTIYFLRRVIDPEYSAGVSPDYVHFESEVIWLDRELVHCQSWLCQGLLDTRPAERGVLDELIRQYRGRFAADFPYEDWASGYRDNLHARFLGEVEKALMESGDPGDLRRRLWLGQQALSIDPEADAIEALVVRLYRQLGASAAAAEQYGHYASVQRDQLGVEPPRLEDL
jgi:DNA-binding SARP family transcriptional activator